MDFPVLHNHNAEAVIGRYDATRSEVRFRPRTVTVDQLLNVGFGVRVLEEEWYEGKRYVVVAQIVELSLDLLPVPCPTCGHDITRQQLADIETQQMADGAREDSLRE